MDDTADISFAPGMDPALRARVLAAPHFRRWHDGMRARRAGSMPGAKEMSAVSSMGRPALSCMRRQPGGANTSAMISATRVR